MTDHETVLRDLLQELGVEGVTLWHIRALAAHRNPRTGQFGLSYSGVDLLASDLRGEDAVLDEALQDNAQRDLLATRLSDAAVGATETPVLECDCAYCRSFRRELASELTAQPATGSP